MEENGGVVGRGLGSSRTSRSTSSMPLDFILFGRDPAEEAAPCSLVRAGKRTEFGGMGSA